MIENPFILRGYISDAYFCDREKETIDLIREIKNGNNITLIAPRRIGKTGLVQHVYAQEEIKDRVLLHMKPFSFNCQLSKRNFSLPSATLARLKISCRRHSSRSTIFLPPVLYKVASKDYWRKILLQKQMEPTNCTISSLVNG